MLQTHAAKQLQPASATPVADASAHIRIAVDATSGQMVCLDASPAKCKVAAKGASAVGSVAKGRKAFAGSVIIDLAAGPAGGQSAPGSAGKRSAQPICSQATGYHQL